MKQGQEDLIPHARAHEAWFSVDNFVKNFFSALGFEYSGMVLLTEIQTLKFKIFNEINGLPASFDICFEKCSKTTQMVVLVEYSAASSMVSRLKRLSNPHPCSSPCLN